MYEYCLFVDAAYSGSSGAAACAVTTFENSARTTSVYTCTVERVAPYVPGRFYLRELPCILKVLERVAEPPGMIFVDAHVWLAQGRPGLGARLFSVLGSQVPVVGMAKNPFLADSDPEGGNPVLRRVFRGTSRRPLYVSGAGVDLETAARLVRGLHGIGRIPFAMKKAHASSKKALHSFIRGPR